MPTFHDQMEKTRDPFLFDFENCIQQYQSQNRKYNSLSIWPCIYLVNFHCFGHHFIGKTEQKRGHLLFDIDNFIQDFHKIEDITVRACGHAYIVGRILYFLT